jgi:hypothetical protein
MSQFAATYDVAVNADHVFYKQVVGGLHHVATKLIAEGAQGERLTWARRVQLDPTTEGKRWIWKMLTNGTFAGNPTGADDGAVVSIIESFLTDMLKA